MTLTPEIAGLYLRTALGHVSREYPNIIMHVFRGPQDAATPRELHPVFFGSFDWHSCVHGWWTLMMLARLYPDLPEAAEVRALSRERFTPEAVAIETEYVLRPESRGFERPYGWAWLLKLAAEADLHEDRHVADTLAPLTRAIADRFRAFLPISTYPVRVGTHYNTAFALRLTLDWAETADPAFAALIRDKAVAWHAADHDCQAWEPSQDEFLSPALMEAELMRRVLPPANFATWFDAFLPRLSERQPATLFTPATVSDRSDGKIAHLDGLNLSRAWCWRGIASALPATDPRHAIAQQAAADHLDSALGQVTGDYMGEHWLASFALLALQAP